MTEGLVIFGVVCLCINWKIVGIRRKNNTCEKCGHIHQT